MINKIVYIFWRISMFCKKCGKEISENAKFCQYCGESIGIKNKYIVKHLGDNRKNIIENKEDYGIDSIEGNSEKIRKQKYMRSFDSKLTKKIPKKILALIGGLIVAIILFIILRIVNSGEYLLEGDWVLISNDYENNMPQHMELEKNGDASIDNVFGDFEADSDKQQLVLNGQVYEYFIQENLLFVEEYAANIGNGDVGIYLNKEKATAEEIRIYDYAVEQYDILDFEEYLKGDWYEGWDKMEGSVDVDIFLDATDEKFSLKEDETGVRLSYRLKVPEHNDNAKFVIDGNVVKIDNLNAFKVIPLSETAAYFYCYAGQEMIRLDKLE